MGKFKKTTREELAAQEERSRQFRELLERRVARDAELKAARERAERSERAN